MRDHLRRGFTLIEMMIGVVLGSLIVLGAVAFASQEVRTLAVSGQVLELTQVGRTVIDMISDDVANAGMGVGYRADGSFAGLDLGTTARAGANFQSNNRAVAFDGFATTSDDLVLALADGATASIVSSPRGDLAGQDVVTCAAPADEIRFSVGERVLVRDAFGLAAASYYVVAVPVPVAACPGGVVCEGGGGCTTVTLGADSEQWTSDVDAATADYARGQLIGNFRQVVWFVDDVRNGRLRRHTLTNTPEDCSAFDCGAIVAEGVESLQFRVRARDAAGWTDVTAAPRINDNRPIRVDIELAMRARTQDATNMRHDPALLLLESPTGVPQCLPGPCGTQTLIRREVFRATVEIKNSGYMRLSGGAT